MIQECDRAIEKKYHELPAKADPEIQPPPAPKRTPRKPRRNEPAFDLRTQLYQMAGVDLTAIDGCNVATIPTILAEIGTDMRPWATVRHFTSWLRLCPHNDISGGKVLKSRTQKTKNRANTALRLAAQAVSWI